MDRPDVLLSDVRIPELDGLRGVAVIMVMVWHFTGSIMLEDQSWFTSAIRSLTVFGRTGVDLFFVLSGFLIIGILIDHKNSSNRFRVFYIRRLMRIQPPYFVLIFAYWLCYLLTGPNVAFNTEPSLAAQIVSQVTFTWNWLMTAHDSGVANGFSVTWSVGIEEWFYLIFPALIWLTPRRYLAGILISVGASSALGRIMAHQIWPHATLMPYIFTPLRLDGLCIGGLLAIAYRNDIFIDALRRRREIALVGSALVIPIPFIIAMVKKDLMSQMALWGHFYLAVAYACALLGILVTQKSGGVRILRHWFLRAAGRYSYSLYLFHPLFISFIFVLAGRRELLTSGTDALLLATALAASVLFCLMLYRVVEAPSQRYGKSWVYKDRIKQEPVLARPSLLLKHSDSGSPL